MDSTAFAIAATDGGLAFVPTTAIGPDPTGPVSPGLLPAKIATSGTPSAAAMYKSPVSTPTTDWAPAMRGNRVERLAYGNPRARQRSCDMFAARALRRRAPRQHQVDSVAAERAAERDPMCLRAFLCYPRN